MIAEGARTQQKIEAGNQDDVLEWSGLPEGVVPEFYFGSVDPVVPQWSENFALRAVDSMNSKVGKVSVLVRMRHRARTNSTTAEELIRSIGRVRRLP